MLTGKEAEKLYYTLVTKGYLMDCMGNGNSKMYVYTLSNNGTIYAYTVRMEGDDIIYIKSVTLEHRKLSAKHYMDRSGGLS